MSDPVSQSEPNTDDRLALNNPVMNVPKKGIIPRLLHGTGAGAFGYGLGIASNLLLLPLYLHRWSVAEYGEWMALYSVVMYLANLDFGVTTAAVNAATIAHARNDWPTFKRVQGTAWAVSLVIAAFGGVLVAALSLFYFHVDRWLGLTVLGHHDARIIFCCLAVSLLANIPGAQLIAVYTSTGEFAKYQWLYNAYALFSCIVTAVALSLGAGPVSLAAVTAGTTLSTIATSLWLLSRKGSRLYPRLRDSRWHMARSLAAPTGQFGLTMLASALTIQGPIVVLSRALGGPAVALFTTTRTVANVVRGTLMLLRAPLRPEFSRASALPTTDALRRLFRFAVSLDVTIAISLSAVLWSGGVWLIRFWSHGRIHPDPMLLHLLLIASVLEGFLQILAIAGWATNQFQAVSLGLLASAVISLLVAVALVGRFGPSAVPLGAIIPLILIMTPVAVRNACSEAHLTLWFVVGRLVLPFAAIVAFSASLPAWLASLRIASPWLYGVVTSLAICAVAAFTGVAVFLTSEDRKVVRDRIIVQFSRKKHPEVPQAAKDDSTMPA
jgi:O-antigen/teichoic acid export membrane protein